MATIPSSTEREQRLERVLADYLHAVEAGTPPDRGELRAQHPDLAADLDSFFRNRDAMERIAEPIKRQLPGPETMAPPGAESAGDSPTIRYFGDYELLQEIARGGMGVVYKARQVSLDRVVAVKMILAGQLASEADVARFRAEASAAGNLDHPNIVPIYEVGEHQGQHYFSMKLVEGRSLAQWIADFRLQIVDLRKDRQAGIARLIAAAARAVHHAHQRGILHRDLKPANILLQGAEAAVCNLQSAIPLITDFGLARRVEGDGRLTQSGAIVGTPSYMAPEQARSEKVLTTAVDVYSLGAILYELLTGCPPFRAATPLDTVLQVLEREPAPPRSMHAEIDRDLETICLKCLEKEVAKRYGSAEALADDLERWLRGEPIQARRSSMRERVVKWARRRPAVAALLVISVLSLLTLLIGGVSYSTRLRASLEASRRHVYAAHMNEALDAWQNSDLPRLVELLDAHRPQPGQEDLRGFEWYYLWRLCHRDRFTVPAHGGTVAAVAVSADCRTIATGGGDGVVTLMDAATGKQLGELSSPLKPFAGTRSGPSLDTVLSLGFSADCSTLTGIAEEIPGQVTVWDAQTRQERGTVDKLTAASLSPDGALLAWGDASGSIHLLNTLNAQVVREVDGHKKKILALAFSPDCQALVSASEDETVRLWNPATGAQRASLASKQGHWSFGLAVAPKGRAVTLRSDSGDILVWYPESGKKRVVAAPRRASVAFAPDGRTLAIGMTDLFRLQASRTVRQGKSTSTNSSLSLRDDRLHTRSYADFLKIVDVATGQERVLRGHTAGISCLAFSPDSRLLATASDDMSVRLWDVGSAKESFALLGHVDGVSALSFAPDGSFLVTGSQDGAVKRWDLTALTEKNILTGNGGWIVALAFSPDGTTLVSASTGKTGASISFRGEMKLWDTASGQELATLPAEGWAVSALDFSPDGSLLATCTEKPQNAEVTLWDLPARKVKAKWQTVRGVALRFLLDGKTLATCDRQTNDGIKLWDVATQQERAVLKVQNRNRCLTLAPGGRMLAAGDWDKGQIELWDMNAEAPDRILGTPWNEGFASAFGDYMGNSSVAFSPDGRTLAHARRTAGLIGGRGSVRLFDVSSGRERLTLQGHKGEVWSVAFAPDGKTLASGSEDRTIKLWDPVTGDQRLTLRGHDGRITTVAFSPDGTTLATASWDGTVRLWRAANRAEVDARIGSEKAE
jgi:WD40 repeat protein/serine/threonine protein kinase